MALKELSQYQAYNVRRDMEKSLSTLKGILEGISCDSIISADEVVQLRSWVTLQEALHHLEPLKSILATISSALDDGILSEEEYADISWACRQALEKTDRYDPSTIAMQVLHGIMHGILADGEISDDEIGYIQNWLYDFDFLKGSYPYDELDSLIIDILKDGVITSNERDILKLFFSDFVLSDTQGAIRPEEVAVLRDRYSLVGICSTCPEIIFDDHVFCFTGISSRCKRKDIASKVEALGGKYIDRVSNKTDYLIIGNGGNPCFAYSCYGRKVEEAVGIRKAGGKIVLVHENDFWDEIE